MSAGTTIIYGENFEDPKLEWEALSLGPGARIRAVAGGGCTVLSLLRSAPSALDAVDSNPDQLRLLALKRAAVVALEPDVALGFLGGAAMPGRMTHFQAVLAQLDAGDSEFWQERTETVAKGALESGRAERFVALLRRLVALFVHPVARIEALFAQADLDAQRKFFHERWDTWRWRALFALLRRRRLDAALVRGAYAHVRVSSLGEALRARAEHRLTTLPSHDNYFLSRMLLGRYLPHPEGRPPYLQPEGVRAVRSHGSALALRHTDLLAWLASCPAQSYDALYLSNVPEWLPEERRVKLFREVERVARPRARVCWRALMQERGLPPEASARLVVDEAASASLERRDRAFVNAAFRVAEARP